MHLKIPPPVVALIIAATMWLSRHLLPGWTMSSEFLHYAAFAIAAAGLVIEAASVILFIRAKTTVNPLNPRRSNSLVVGGLYQYTRNPMYLGMLLLLLGFALWLSHPFTLIPLVFFVWYITQFQIKPEERILLDKFRDDYANYKKRVRRWL